MNALRHLAAFIAGLAVYQLAVIVLGGFLAAVAIPKSYFDWFGTQLEWALVTLNFATLALPIFAAVTALIFGVARFLDLRSSFGRRAFALGMLACFGFWISQSPAPTLSAAFAAGWWEVPVQIAPWLAAGLAGWLLSRRAWGEAVGASAN